MADLIPRRPNPSARPRCGPERRPLLLHPRFPLLVLLLLLTVAPACRSQERTPPETPPDTTAAPTPDPVAGMTDGGRVAMPEARRRAALKADSLWAEALRIHYNALAIDGHVDTPALMLDDGYRLADRHPAHAAHLDLPRMAEGGLDAAFFSIYVAPYYGEGADAVRRARALIAEVERQVGADSGAAMAYTAEDVRRIARSGRKAVLLGLEGGHALAASPDTLRALYRAGIRYVTLTHINTNAWADASQSPPRHGGLNALGRSLVATMNRLGVAVDLAHVSDSTFYDALDASTAPVLVSHSSVRALTPSVRNLDDAMLRALARNGGVVMINFFDAMVNPHLDADVMADVRRRLPGDRLTNLWNTVYAVKRERGLPGATLDDVLDHIDHAVRVAGIDHVGLGSDFDGVFDLPAGLEDVTRLPWITYGLLKRGYAEDAIYKILGGNVLRVMEAVEAGRQE
ncbi:MAG: dipeptidase [Rhodothermales bacterium]|nr:dipeptidase [Rhodothermales bacterium]